MHGLALPMLTRQRVGGFDVRLENDHIDSGFWRIGRKNVVANAGLCMDVVGGWGVVNVFRCREK